MPVLSLTWDLASGPLFWTHGFSRRSGSCWLACFWDSRHLCLWRIKPFWMEESVGILGESQGHVNLLHPDWCHWFRLQEGRAGALGMALTHSTAGTQLGRPLPKTAPGMAAEAAPDPQAFRPIAQSPVLGSLGASDYVGEGP